MDNSRSFGEILAVLVLIVGVIYVGGVIIRLVQTLRESRREVKAWKAQFVKVNATIPTWQDRVSAKKSGGLVGFSLSRWFDYPTGGPSLWFAVLMGFVLAVPASWQDIQLNWFKEPIVSYAPTFSTQFQNNVFTPVMLVAVLGMAYSIISWFHPVIRYSYQKTKLMAIFSGAVGLFGMFFFLFPSWGYSDNQIYENRAKVIKSETKWLRKTVSRSSELRIDMNDSNNDFIIAVENAEYTKPTYESIKGNSDYYDYDQGTPNFFDFARTDDMSCERNQDQDFFPQDSDPRDSSFYVTMSKSGTIQITMKATDAKWYINDIHISHHNPYYNATKLLVGTLHYKGETYPVAFSSIGL